MKKQIKCIKKVPADEFICHSVTVGKVYEVLENTGNFYVIEDDLGEDRYYEKEFFETVETEKIFKKGRIGIHKS